MQSYIKYKAYYDKRASAAPLKVEDQCLVLHPKADTQSTKIPFTEFLWTGPYTVEKVLPNNNYVVRKLGTNKTQTLHRIRLRLYPEKNRLLDIQVAPEQFVPDTDVTITHDDLYAQAWETDFGDPIFYDDESSTKNSPEEVVIPTDNPPTVSVPPPGNETIANNDDGDSPPTPTHEPDTLEPEEDEEPNQPTQENAPNTRSKTRSLRQNPAPKQFTDYYRLDTSTTTEN